MRARIYIGIFTIYKALSYALGSLSGRWENAWLLSGIQPFEPAEWALGRDSWQPRCGMGLWGQPTDRAVSSGKQIRQSLDQGWRRWIWVVVVTLHFTSLIISNAWSAFGRGLRGCVKGLQIKEPRNVRAGVFPTPWIYRQGNGALEKLGESHRFAVPQLHSLAQERIPHRRLPAHHRAHPQGRLRRYLSPRFLISRKKTHLSLLKRWSKNYSTIFLLPVAYLTDFL